MRVLLLSGYDAPSHRRWREALAARLPDWQWTQLASPPRHFKWRLRGNGFLWAHRERALLEQHWDRLIVTSMVDLVTLRGFVPSLARVPTLVYFHENQFAYPLRAQQRANVEPQLVNLYTALCADRLAFNSDYNRRQFLEGARRLLKRLPDAAPEDVLAQLEARSERLPVPMEADCYQTDCAPASGPLRLVWNHRWEYDKAPERLLAGLKAFFEREDRPEVVVHVVGQQFRQQPEAFDELKALLEGQGALGHWGYLPERADYRRLLAESHMVLSTALHDFQGLSVLEAVAAGCAPLLPEREAYPEWFGPDWLYASHRYEPGAEAEAFAERLTERYRQWQGGGRPPVPSVDFLHERHWSEAYRERLERLSV